MSVETVRVGNEVRPGHVIKSDGRWYEVLAAGPWRTPAGPYDPDGSRSAEVRDSAGHETVITVRAGATYPTLDHFPRRRGRPAVGPALTIRLPDELRERVEAAALPGETDLAATVRRLLDVAADLPPSALDTVRLALLDRAAEHDRMAKARQLGGPAGAGTRAAMHSARDLCHALAERVASHLPPGRVPLTVAEAFPNRRRQS
jgi:hypothetical protein